VSGGVNHTQGSCLDLAEVHTHVAASMGLLKRLSRKLQASILIFYGRWGLPVPYRKRLKFIIGKPIKVGLAPGLVAPGSIIIRSWCNRGSEGIVLPWVRQGTNSTDI
jgi:hypothetical protein